MKYSPTTATVVAYLTGCMCVGTSIALFRVMHFEHTNLLAVAGYAVANYIQYKTQTFSTNGALAGSSLILGLLFTPTAAVVCRKHSALRILGWGMIIVLAFATLYWGRLSPGILDPSPSASPR